ncbi:PREDICTED: leucine-rich repeat-containing protein 26-like isoform X2 [Hipposideros armiger]|nr:PREDICTED: leucine-rich repeat-containing protein 26-like isoform X2 [Hipposideros armiger]XP_019496449.1 PREDICTED: leucine-rich repeat-containing protein 26-like isoform X2 [Hipposideros armiger]
MKLAGILGPCPPHPHPTLRKPQDRTCSCATQKGAALDMRTGLVPLPHPHCHLEGPGESLWGTASPASGTDGLLGHTSSRRPTAGPTAAPMPSPSFLSRRPPPLLLLLLSPWPIWAQAPAAATPTGTPGALDCPEACACAPGGQANCSERALSAVPAGLNRRVRALLLDHNHVRALPPGAFAGAGALRRLDLRENGLRWVHARAFWGLGALQQLDLSFNQLEALAPGTFASMRALRALSLANNRLALLEPAAVGALPLLHALSLQDNELSALAPNVLAGLPALNVLRLRGNPWACGCSLRPLCAWLRGHPRPAPEAETLLCVSPGRLTLSPLTAFSDAAFSHCVQPLAPRDLAVIYALGPVSFLISLATCLALGFVLTACRTRRRCCTAARRPPRRPLNSGAGWASSPADPGSPAAAAQV